MTKSIDIRYIAPQLVEQTIASIEREYISAKSLSVHCYENAVVVPGAGVFDGCGCYVKGTSVHDGWPWEGRDCPNEVVSCESDAVFIGTFNPCWGHCLTDALQRLWFLIRDDQHFQGAEFVYSVSPVTSAVPDNFFELLSLIGLKQQKLRRIAEATRFRHLYIPDSCFYNDAKKKQRRFTKEYRDIIKFIIATATNGCKNENSPGRLYFSRTGWRTNKEIGERRVEKVFENLGYEIVHPENLSFTETVRLLSECKSFASTDGSIAHNVLFLPEQSDVVIVRKAMYVNDYQDCVCSVRHLNVTYIDANLSSALYDRKAPWLGPFFLYVNNRLASFAECKPRFPLCDFIRYYICALFRKWRASLASFVHGR